MKKMETTGPEKKKNPMECANIISRLFFWWTMKLFRKGAKKGLTMEDIWPPMASDGSEKLANKLETAWMQELKKYEEDRKCHLDEENVNLKKPSLTKTIMRTFWLRYFAISLIVMFQTVVLQNMMPIFQGFIIKYFDMPDKHSMSQNQVLLYATGLITTIFSATLILHHTGLRCHQIGMRIRVACCSLIYRKSLKLSKAAIDKTAAGQVINLVSNDVNRFDMLLLFLNSLWIAPIQIIVVGYIVWQSIGIYTLVAIGSLMAMTIPLQGYLSKISGRLRELIAKLTDRRVQLMNELISGIQVVKMYAWEKPFNKIVSETRKKEMRQIHRSSNIKAFYTSLFVIIKRLTLFLTIVTFISSGNVMSADIIFPLVSYFNILQLIAAILLPVTIMLTGETLTSIKRIEEFLLLDEIQKNLEDPKKKIQPINSDQIKTNSNCSVIKQSSPVHIEVNRVFANWKVSQLPPTLNDISLKVKGGELCSIIGAVGSGKSSLLHLLLQELQVGAGVVRLFRNAEEQSIDYQSMRGFFQDNSNINISYASQDPWLFTGTVRENILFGQEFNRTRYQEVTKVCSLLRDFKQFPNYDMTIVGERGVSLSGGQRARINLARAIYRQADIYLLDDPLSAVDVKVARRLFNECIVEFLKGKTRILATHQIHHLKQADSIFVLDKGMIKFQGSFETLTETNADFNDLLKRLKEDKKESENKCDNVVVEDINQKENFDKSHFLRRISTRTSKISITSLDSYQCMSNDDRLESEIEAGKLEAETKETGKLSAKLYFHYFRQGASIFSMICLAFIYILAEVATSGADYWLSYWTNLESMKACLNNSLNNCKFTKSEYDSMVNTPLFNSLSFLDENGFLKTNNAIYVYTICMSACIVLVIWRSVSFMKISMNASQKLHDNMFANILRATMRFFNMNPSGRILNRFSKDVGTMDEVLPRSILETIQILLSMICILVIISIVNTWMIIPIVIISIIFYFFRNYYLCTAQDVKRLEGIAKSPVFSHITTTLNGITTIRSSGQDTELMLRNQFDKLQDDHTGAYYLVIATGSAFGFAIDMVLCAFVGCVCFSFIIMGPENAFGASVGLAISQALILNGMVQYGVRESTEVQAHMTSVERIIQYTDLPKEDVGKSYSSPENWPSKGQIQFKSLSLSYKKDDPAVLKNINLTIEPGWKVGVVGRTGAGKSSLITALFRLVHDELLGEIIIDDKDTKEINLQDLRSSISIIPQEPVLFSETLRYNLDPFGKYTDDVIWDALKEVELSDLILDQWVTEGGTNFSVGQRQLICLARALLRNNKILVLDEATANIDSQTDALIQRAIRSKFIGCTVITVAHRLNTIIDSDRVLVMDAGQAMEFDSPYELLFKKQNSLFSQMIEQTGSAMAKKLYKEASMYHEKSINAQNDVNVTDDVVFSSKL